MTDRPPTIELLPKDQWESCKKCKNPVPGFANLPEPLRLELEALVKNSPIRAMQRLRQITGCNFEVANAWFGHHWGACREPCTTPCPHCGQFLRTPQAKQCRFCGADWH